MSKREGGYGALWGNIERFWRLTQPAHPSTGAWADAAYVDFDRRQTTMKMLSHGLVGPTADLQALLDW